MYWEKWMLLSYVVGIIQFVEGLRITKKGRGRLNSLWLAVSARTSTVSCLDAPNWYLDLDWNLHHWFSRRPPSYATAFLGLQLANSRWWDLPASKITWGYHIPYNKFLSIYTLFLSASLSSLFSHSPSLPPLLPSPIGCFSRQPWLIQKLRYFEKEGMFRFTNHMLPSPANTSYTPFPWTYKGGRSKRGVSYLERS